MRICVFIVLHSAGLALMAHDMTSHDKLYGMAWHDKT